MRTSLLTPAEVDIADDIFSGRASEEEKHKFEISKHAEITRAGEMATAEVCKKYGIG